MCIVDWLLVGFIFFGFEIVDDMVVIDLDVDGVIVFDELL